MDQPDWSADVVDEDLALAVGKTVVDLAPVAESIVCVVDGTGAFTLVVDILTDVSYSVERFVAAMAMSLPILEVAFIYPEMILERA